MQQLRLPACIRSTCGTGAPRPRVVGQGHHRRRRSPCGSPPRLQPASTMRGARWHPTPSVIALDHLYAQPTDPDGGCDLTWQARPPAGLPSIPPALRPSRVMRAMEFPMRAPSTPGVAPLPRRRTTGADYDTSGLDPNRHGWRAQRSSRPDAPRSRRPRIAGSPRRRPPARARGAGDLRGQPSQPPRHPTPAHIDPRAVAAQDRGRCSCRLLLRNPHHRCHVGTGIGAIPIERAKTGRKSADLAAELIDGGWSLLISQKVAAALTAGVSRSAGAAYLAAEPACRSCRCTLPARADPAQGRSLPRPSNTSVTSVGRSPLPATRTRPASPPESSAVAASPTRQPPIGTPLAGEPTGPTAHRSPDPRPGSGVVPGRWATAAVGPQPPEALAGDLDQPSHGAVIAVGPIRRAVPIQHRGARTSPCASRTPSQ